MGSKYLKLNREALISAFKKINLSIIFIVLTDYIFYLLSYLAAEFWLGMLKAKYELAASGLELLDEATLEIMSRQAQDLYYFLFYSLGLFLLALLIFSSLSKSIIWALTAQARMTGQYLLKFLLVKLIWNVSVLAVIILGFVVMEQGAAIIFLAVILAASLYFSGILYPIFTRSLRISAIRESLKLGFSGIPYTILPYSMIVLIGVLLSSIYTISSRQYWIVFSSLIMLSYIALVRYYLSALVYSIKK